MQTTREKNAAWLPSESPRLAFGEPPPFGKGGYGVGWRTAWDGLWNKAVFAAEPPTTRSPGCSENEAQPSGSPHATVANDVKSPCRFSGRVKGAVRCTSSE